MDTSAKGAGLAGFGLLRDDGGKDYYSAIGGSQGFAYFGVGILADKAGR